MSDFSSKIDRSSSHSPRLYAQNTPKVLDRPYLPKPETEPELLYPNHDVKFKASPRTQPLDRLYLPTPEKTDANFMKKKFHYSA
ncbi:MAG: hypothetical protein HEQ32_05315 [Vampirovibrio sp.]